MRIRSRIAAVAALTAAVVGGAAVPAHADTPAPTLSLAPRNAGVIGTGSALDLDLAITNRGSGTLAGGTIRISLERPPVVGTDTLVQQVEHPGTVLQGYLVATTPSPSIPAGRTAQLHVRLSAAVVDSVIDDRPGARLVGASLDVGAPAVLAYSAVTRIPKGFTGSVGLGTVVPITAPANTTGLVPAEELGLLTATGGAWRTALEAATADPKATVLLDPEVQASSRVAGGTAPASATDFLARLGDLPNEVVRLPYADGDVTLERAAGADAVLAPTSFAGGALAAPTPGATPGATASPSPTPSASPSPATRPSDADLLHWAYSGSPVAWPVTGTTTTADLRMITASGYPVTMLSTADVADARGRVAPHARIGSASVLLADATASRLLAEAASGSGVSQDASLAELVDLLGTDAVTREATTVLAVPSRVGSAAGLGRVLQALASRSWIQGTTLAAMAGTTGAPAVRLHRNAVPEERVTPAAAALGAEGKVRELGAAILSNRAALIGPQRLALLGVLSTQWRSPQTGYETAARAVTAGFVTFSNQVKIDRASEINYVGGSGSLPVNVTNRLEEPVRVVVSATSSNGRLQIHGTQTINIPAATTGKALLPVKSISNGDVVVTVTLRTPDGHVIGTPAQRRITINAGWETVGAVVFVVALLALFGTGVYRNVRRARRRGARKR
ncbi:MAG: DUF6049 family protein [Amnibacterium sp.]